MEKLILQNKENDLNNRKTKNVTFSLFNLDHPVIFSVRIALALEAVGSRGNGGRGSLARGLYGLNDVQGGDWWV